MAANQPRRSEPRPSLPDIVIAVSCGLMLAFVAIYLFSVPLAGTMAGRRDFVAYWAAGRQIAHHLNPYDRVAVERLERDAGLETMYPVLMMRNPPWALPLALPLGYVSIRVAVLLWSVGLLACLAGSVWMVRRLYGRPPDHLQWMGLAFAPALLCLIMGQTSLLTLLGFVLFLRLHGRQPWLAGASLWLCSLKPQLFLPFGAVLAAWMILRRDARILGGWLGAMAASCLAAWAVEPSVWRDYAAMMRAERLEQQFVPCLADALRFWVKPEVGWLQYLPAAAACVWALAWFWRRRAKWDWQREGGLLMLVSLVLAPYCWLYDQCLAIPALLGVAWAAQSRWWAAALALLSLGIGFQLAAVKLTSGLYLWTAPVWLAWYMLAAHGARRAVKPPSVERS